MGSCQRRIGAQFPQGNALTRKTTNRTALQRVVGLVIFCSITLFLTAFSICAYAILHQQPHAKGDVIVVLGAGMDSDGSLHAPSIARVETGVGLYRNGAASHIHFTGGRAVMGGPSAGDEMAALALSLGVPSDAITVETESLSTLQNALFSRPYLENHRRIILVTEAFHLPRAVASFWWMGMQDVQAVHSARFRRTEAGLINPRMIGREAVAIWFNLGRALLWSGTGHKHPDLLE